MDMKRFLSRIGLFSIFAVVFYVVWVFVFGHYFQSKIDSNIKFKFGSVGHLHTRLEDVQDESNIDILFMGSSHCYRVFDTRIYEAGGYKTFNLGSSNQTPLQTLLLLRRYLPQLNPKLVVFEVNPIYFSSDGVESSIDVASNSPIDITCIRMAAQMAHPKTTNTLIYSAWLDVLGVKHTLKEDVSKEMDTYIPHGFVERKISYYKPKQYEPEAIEILPEQRDAFEKCISLCKERGIAYKLLYTPMASDNFKSYSNNEYFDSVMTCLGSYENLNGKLPLEDTLHFYDSHHLNQQGVEIVNAYILEKSLN
jgi:hypothetical protein